MSLKELGEKLHEMYNNAQNGETVVMIHLFGIKFASEILLGRHSKKDIAKAAGIPLSYATEITKGVKLANYVKQK